MEKLLDRIRADYPQLTFVESSTFCWSPITKQIFYVQRDKASYVDIFSMLHEVSHAILGHTTYRSDYELLRMELEAWEHAKHIANNYDDIEIDTEHIQDCLDSYRDWLYRRSICPSCGAKSLQCDTKQYQCFNCHNKWLVASSRFCRPYRHSSDTKKPSATFVVADGSF
jgi:hypothetical protein